MKLLLVLLMAILLLQASVQADDSAAISLTSLDEEGNSIALGGDLHHQNKKINCGKACSRRCKKSSRKNLCHRACKSCCERCHCVPPGTYGHHSACPCYASLRTHGNKLKCP